MSNYLLSIQGARQTLPPTSESQPPTGKILSIFVASSLLTFSGASCIRPAICICLDVFLVFYSLRLFMFLMFVLRWKSLWVTLKIKIVTKKAIIIVISSARKVSKPGSDSE